MRPGFRTPPAPAKAAAQAIITDRTRSLALSDQVSHPPPCLDYIILQKEVRDSDRDTLLSQPHTRRLEDGIQDFTDTAALCALVDVVISVDTSFAHLAGALGCPMWSALAFNPDWRWMLGRSNSPWYGSVTLYRQASPRRWGNVLARIGHDLARLAPLPVSERRAL